MERDREDILPETEAPVADNRSRLLSGKSGDAIRLLATGSLTVWLSIVTVLYAWTAVRTVRHPFNAGDDIRWAVTTIVFVGACTLCFSLLSRRVVSRVWFAGLAATSIVILILSRQLVGGLVVVWVLALGWSLGDRLLRWMGAARSPLAFEWTAISLPLGLALLALIGFTLAAFQLLTPMWVAGCLSALSLAQGPDLWSRLRGMRERAPAIGIPPDPPAIERGFVFSLMGFVFLLGLVWAVAPEIHYDALNYHLAVPKLYIENGGFRDLSYFWHSYFAQSVETLFALPLALAGQAGARLLNLAIGAIATLEVYLMARLLSEERAGLWAAALFSSTPLVFWLSTTTYVDLATAMFVSAALLAFLKWRERRELGWVWATGLLLAAAISAKPTAAFAVPVIALVLVRDLLRARRTPSPTLRQLAGFLLAAAAVCLPWYALRYVQTGNPFFPLLNGLFEGSRPVPDAYTPQAIMSGFGSGASARSLIELPLRLTFETGRFGEALPAGGAGLGLLLLVPLGVLLLWRRSSVSVLLAASALYLLLWAVFSQYARYLVPALPIVVALGAANVAHVSPPGKHPNWILLAVGALAQTLVIPVQFWNIPERIPLRLAFGVESREEFLQRSLRTYAAARYLNEVIESGQKVLGVGVEPARFYLNAPLSTPSETWELEPLSSDPSPSRVAAELTRKSYAYLMVDTLTPASKLPFSFLSPGFLARYATAVFQGSGIDVHRLRAPEGRAGP